MQNFELIRNLKKLTSSKLITIIEKNDTRMREYLFLEGVLDCIDKKRSTDYIINALYKNIRNIESNKTFNKILVIDSSSIFCLECENFLTSRNYGVVSTSSFSEGMKKLSNKKYNLLILDLDVLPDNQYEIISKIKREYANLPIMLVSSVKDYATVNDAYRSGVSEFLQKPVFIEELILKVDSKTRANRQLEELLTNQQLLNDYKLIVDNASIVSKIDKNGILTYVNSSCCNISGYEKSDLIGKPFSLVTHEDMPQDYFDDMWTTVRVKKTMWHGKTKNRRKDSSVYYVDSYVMPLLDEDGEILEFIAMRNNINEEEYDL